MKESNCRFLRCFPSRYGMALPTALGSPFRGVTGLVIDAAFPLPTRPLVISPPATASFSPGPSLDFGKGVPLREEWPAVRRLRGQGLVLLWKSDGRPV